jgi:hypothetical protein
MNEYEQKKMASLEQIGQFDGRLANGQMADFDDDMERIRQGVANAPSTAVIKGVKHLDGDFELQRRNSDGKYEAFYLQKKQLLKNIESATRIYAISTPYKDEELSSMARVLKRDYQNEETFVLIRTRIFARSPRKRGGQRKSRTKSGLKFSQWSFSRQNKASPVGVKSW